MNDESTLSNGSDLFFDGLLIIVIVSIVDRRGEYWVRLADNLEWLQLSVVTDIYESPVVETTLPELAEVDADLLLDVVLLHDVSWLELVPGEQMVVVSLDRRWGSQSQENLRVLWVPLVLHDCIDDKVLANTSHHRSESFLKLPVDAIIKHVEEDDSLVPDSNVTVALKLDKEFLDPVEAILVISDLSNEECSLNLLEVLHLFGGVSLPELLCIFVIHFLVEWELLDVDDDL